MSELVIQYHDFENAKKEIKEFSENTTTDLDFKRVDDSKGVGEFLGDWFFGRGIGLDHKVTGEELNELTSQIQTHLHSINNTQIKLIREFGQVYSALEALDKDYIQAILVSIKATEETSQSIQETQGQIKKIVENQRKTLEELKKFKQKLDGYVHLGDIDKIWSDCSGLIEKLESIIAFTTALEQVAHLKDVDELWKQTEDHQIRIKRVEQEGKSHTDKLKKLVQTDDRIRENIDANVHDINCLKEYTEKLDGFSHLYDVDNIWKDVEKHTSQLADSEKRDEELATAIQKNKDEVDKKIADAVQTANTVVESLTKRINYAYWIAGGSAMFAIIEMILLLVKVM